MADIIVIITEAKSLSHCPRDRGLGTGEPMTNNIQIIATFTIDEKWIEVIQAVLGIHVFRARQETQRLVVARAKKFAWVPHLHERSNLTGRRENSAPRYWESILWNKTTASFEADSVPEPGWRKMSRESREKQTWDTQLCESADNQQKSPTFSFWCPQWIVSWGMALFRLAMVLLWNTHLSRYWICINDQFSLCPQHAFSQCCWLRSAPFRLSYVSRAQFWSTNIQIDLLEL